MRPAHPAAEAFPLMSEFALQGLVDDIKANGLLTPIVMLGGAILDGRNRWAACEQLGIEPATIEYDGDDPIGFVVSMNLARRDLTEGQRALAARRLVKLQADQARKTRTRDRQQAALPGVTVETAEMAAQVDADGEPELVQAVERGEIPLSVAAAISKMEPDQQRAVVERVQHEDSKPPVRAKQGEHVMSVAMRIEPVDLVALKAALPVLERSVHPEIKRAAAVVRMLVPMLGGG